MYIVLVRMLTNDFFFQDLKTLIKLIMLSVPFHVMLKTDAIKSAEISSFEYSNLNRCHNIYIWLILPGLASAMLENLKSLTPCYNFFVLFKPTDRDHPVVTKYIRL